MGDDTLLSSYSSLKILRNNSKIDFLFIVPIMLLFTFLQMEMSFSPLFFRCFTFIFLNILFAYDITFFLTKKEKFIKSENITKSIYQLLLAILATRSAILFQTLA